MYLIFGLGNPGSRYQFTRHNIGFMVLEKLAAQLEVDLKQKSFDALWNRGKIAGQQCAFGDASNIHEFKW